MALLASPRRTLVGADLLRQLTLLKALLADCPYSDRVTVTELTPPQIVAYGEEMKVITRRAHPLGDLVQMSDAAAVLAAVLPQQHRASVRAAVADRLRLRRQCLHEPYRHRAV